MQGMAEDSNTRSSLLWQVKRILSELNETDSLPQVLLMENVPAIISPINKPHYQKWLDFLDSLGYSSYNQILNGCDYGVAQNRERMFCVSLLGDYNYNFVNSPFSSRSISKLLAFSLLTTNCKACSSVSGSK